MRYDRLIVHLPSVGTVARDGCLQMWSFLVLAQLFPILWEVINPSSQRLHSEM